MKTTRVILLLLITSATLALLSISITFAGDERSEFAPDAETAADAAGAPEETAADNETRNGLETTGGPDAFGYTYLDSDEPGGPIVSWVEISSTGTSFALPDSALEGPLDLGFGFDFYGRSYTATHIASNGYLWFDNGLPHLTDSSNDCPLPNSFGNENIIAAIWDDLDGQQNTPHGQGYHQAFPAGSCPYDDYTGACFVAEWSGTYHDGTADDLTFEILLFDDNDIVIQIADASNEAGSSSTTGIENDDGSDGLSYGTCNSVGHISDALSIRYHHPPPTPRLDGSTKTAPPLALSGDIITYTVVLSNSGDLAASGAALTDTLPAGTSFVPGSLSASGGSAAFDGTHITWNGNISIGGEVVIIYAVDTSGATCGVPFTNAAEVFAPGLAAPIQLAAQTTIWDNQDYFFDFETDDGGFQAAAGSEWARGVPTFPTGITAYSGINVWGTDLGGDADDTIGDHFLTRTLALPASDGAVLTWWDWYGDEASDERQVEIDGVEIWNDNGGTDQMFWAPQSVDLTPFSEQTVLLAFDLEVCCGNPGPEGWYLDDVAIFSCTPPPARISLQKTVGTDAHSCATTDNISVAPGTAVTYCYDVTNTGILTLTEHDLVDSHLGTILSSFPYTLPPGASLQLTQTVTLTQTVVNTATWTATDPGHGEVARAADTAVVHVVPPEPLVCNGSTVAFEAGIPSDWTVVNNAPGNPVFWTGLSNCGETGNYATGSGGAACASSDLQGGGSGLYDTELWSPPFDLSGGNLFALDYWANYGNFANGDFLDLDISSNGGITWTNLLQWNEDHHPNGLRTAPGENVAVDLSAYAGGSNLRLRWRYYDPVGPVGDTDWYAQVDDIALNCSPGTVSITMTKTVGTDPAVCAPSDSTVVPLGSAAYYCFAVTNTGTLTTSVHDLVDDQLGAVFTGFAYDLAPGATIDTVQLGLEISATIHTTTTNTATWTAHAGAFAAVFSDTATVNVTLPEALITPTSLTSTQKVDTQVTLPLTISNVGAADLVWTIIEQDGRSAHTPAPAAIGDERLRIDVSRTTGSLLVLGVEYAQDSYWVTTAGFTNTAQTNYLYQLDNAGNLINSWPQPTSSVWGWRDLAWDGTYLYASDSNGVDQIDPATGITTGVTIPCPTNPCRALAYDPATDHFWSQNFSSSLYEFSRDGTVINTYSGNGLDAYGAAWDAWSPGGPFIWIWSQNGPASNQLVMATQIDPATGDPTGVSFTGTALGAAGVDDNIAGGAAISSDVIPGLLTFLGLHQAPTDQIIGYDLNVCVPGNLPWLSVNPAGGTTAIGQSAVVDVTFDTTLVAPGVYSGTLCVATNHPVDPFTQIPLLLTVTARTTALAIAHLAPFATDPGTAVTLTLDHAPVLTDFTYAASTGYLTVFEGQHLVQVFPDGGSTPLISDTINLLPDKAYSLLVIGDGVHYPLALLALLDDNTPPAIGFFRMRIGHLVPFATPLAATAVDIRLQDGTPLLTGIQYGDITPYIPFAAGTLDLKVTTPGGGRTLVDLAPVTYTAGDIVSLFGVGDDVHQPLGVFAYPAGIPGALLPYLSERFYLPVSLAP